MLMCFHFSWMEISIIVYNRITMLLYILQRDCIFVWCSLIFHLKVKLNMAPNSNKKLFLGP